MSYLTTSYNQKPEVYKSLSSNPLPNESKGLPSWATKDSWFMAIFDFIFDNSKIIRENKCLNKSKIFKEITSSENRLARKVDAFTTNYLKILDAEVFKVTFTIPNERENFINNSMQRLNKSYLPSFIQYIDEKTIEDKSTHIQYVLKKIKESVLYKKEEYYKKLSEVDKILYNTKLFNKFGVNNDQEYGNLVKDELSEFISKEIKSREEKVKQKESKKTEIELDVVNNTPANGTSKEIEQVIDKEQVIYEGLVHQFALEMISSVINFPTQMISSKKDDDDHSVTFLDFEKFEDIDHKAEKMAEKQRFPKVEFKKAKQAIQNEMKAIINRPASFNNTKKPLENIKVYIDKQRKEEEKKSVSLSDEYVKNLIELQEMLDYILS